MKHKGLFVCLISSIMLLPGIVLITLNYVFLESDVCQVFRCAIPTLNATSDWGTRVGMVLLYASAACLVVGLSLLWRETTRSGTRS